ncbi:DUF1365 domain-containing protein [Afifella marina]|uniref:DUF1365 domain-containing protein n=1 Tax=Afifella marina DSM 2698 TaxID=1120955 RepID=A0A1G5MYW1_AFIMA|nr:DUF1365 family protein [Afifella marina]MBK1622206.1 DUF1365 domain-containing protein [Afifella marina DSM 2698]MBK1628331.1 DUF1365 domain-containing protein [Afifella marina]MBK5918990.1 DUF1365 domain-containing protein [Afifella marina]RAI20267.1 DUF1365 domain-containing protein [Afifella marina DSM 2698]SCZ30292.1 hypothetical protein SAMN03080610_01241 [Afifella marina DSM 2698]
MTFRSAIYAGDVVHSRMRPRRHRLHYRVFSLLVDLDELESLSRRLRFFGYNRFALLSFYDADHGRGEAGGLRAWVSERLTEAGIEAEGGRVALLTYPRFLGYVFNPLSVYFCYDRNERLVAILHEVSNTFSEKHTYVIPVTGEAQETIEQACDKLMYVSPFIPMECRYHFRIAPPEESVLVRIAEEDSEGPLLIASFAGERRAMSDRGLFKAVMSHPLMTWKVTGGIYYEALRLWWKGMPLFRHEKAAQRYASTIVLPHAQKGDNPQ